MEDIRIYKVPSKGWYVTDAHGEHSVTFILKTEGWEIDYIERWNEEREEWDEIHLTFEMRGKKHRLEFMINGEFNIYIDRVKLSHEFFLNPGNPFTQFFKKTGKHVLTGKEITIPIYHSFDKQMY